MFHNNVVSALRVRLTSGLTANTGTMSNVLLNGLRRMIVVCYVRNSFGRKTIKYTAKVVGRRKKE